MRKGKAKKRDVVKAKVVVLAWQSERVQRVFLNYL